MNFYVFLCVKAHFESLFCQDRKIIFPDSAGTCCTRLILRIISTTIRCPWHHDFRKIFNFNFKFSFSLARESPVETQEEIFLAHLTKKTVSIFLVNAHIHNATKIFAKTKCVGSGTKATCASFFQNYKDYSRTDVIYFYYELINC